MGRSRVADLKNAKEVLNALKLKSTAKLVESMEGNVALRKGISWPEMQTFLDTFELEAQKHSKTCQQTFKFMEKILMQALDDSKGSTLSELKIRALHAPSVDHHIEALNAGLSTVHTEIKGTSMKVTSSKQTCALLLMLMFGHVVRWQVLEDFVKEWVGHWGKGLNQELNDTGVELLLTIKFAAQSSSTLKADTRMYRNAIAHGHFQFKDEQHLEFWNRDERNRKHKLPSLTLGDLFELYNRTEIRFRTMEAYSRVIRAWGRHPSETK